MKTLAFIGLLVCFFFAVSHGPERIIGLVPLFFLAGIGVLSLFEKKETNKEV
jgi:hypothetical protein